MKNLSARAIGFEPEISIEAGIAETMAWYRAHRAGLPKRYDVFKDRVFRP